LSWGRKKRNRNLREYERRGGEKQKNKVEDFECRGKKSKVVYLKVNKLET
jgi:hypothetical protein